MIATERHGALPSSSKDGSAVALGVSAPHAEPSLGGRETHESTAEGAAVSFEGSFAGVGEEMLLIVPGREGSRGA